MNRRGNNSVEMESSIRPEITKVNELCSDNSVETLTQNYSAVEEFTTISNETSGQSDFVSQLLTIDGSQTAQSLTETKNVWKNLCTTRSLTDLKTVTGRTSPSICNVMQMEEYLDSFEHNNEGGVGFERIWSSDKSDTVRQIGGKSNNDECTETLHTKEWDKLRSLFQATPTDESLPNSSPILNESRDEGEISTSTFQDSTTNVQYMERKTSFYLEESPIDSLSTASLHDSPFSFLDEKDDSLDHDQFNVDLDVSKQETIILPTQTSKEKLRVENDKECILIHAQTGLDNSNKEESSLKIQLNEENGAFFAGEMEELYTIKTKMREISYREQHFHTDAPIGCSIREIEDLNNNVLKVVQNNLIPNHENPTFDELMDLIHRASELCISVTFMKDLYYDFFEKSVSRHCALHKEQECKHPRFVQESSINLNGKMSLIQAIRGLQNSSEKSKETVEKSLIDVFFEYHGLNTRLSTNEIEGFSQKITDALLNEEDEAKRMKIKLSQTFLIPYLRAIVTLLQEKPRVATYLNDLRRNGDDASEKSLSSLIDDVLFYHTNRNDYVPDPELNDEITAFLHRFACLVKGGHFPENRFEDLPLVDLKHDEIEVDYVYGLIAKDNFKYAFTNAKKNDIDIEQSNLLCYFPLPDDQWGFDVDDGSWLGKHVAFSNSLAPMSISVSSNGTENSESNDSLSSSSHISESSSQPSIYISLFPVIDAVTNSDGIYHDDAKIQQSSIAFSHIGAYSIEWSVLLIDCEDIREFGKIIGCIKEIGVWEEDVSSISDSWASSFSSSDDEDHISLGSSYFSTIDESKPVGSTFEELQKINENMILASSFLASDPTLEDNVEDILYRARKENVPHAFMGEIYRDCLDRTSTSKFRVKKKLTEEDLESARSVDFSVKSFGSIEELDSYFPVGTTLPELKILNINVRKCHELLNELHSNHDNLGEIFLQARAFGISRQMFDSVFEDTLAKYRPAEPIIPKIVETPTDSF